MCRKMTNHGIAIIGVAILVFLSVACASTKEISPDKLTDYMDEGFYVTETRLSTYSGDSKYIHLVDADIRADVSRLNESFLEKRIEADKVYKVFISVRKGMMYSFLYIYKIDGLMSIEEAQSRPKTETQVEKYNRLVAADGEKLVVGSDNRTTIESIEAVLQPQVITGIGEITDAIVNEPGRPYYFKLRAIYKGHDTSAKRVLLQDLGTQSDLGTAAMGAAFGIDTNVYPIQLYDVVVSTLPTEANAVATFYIIASRITEHEGQRGNVMRQIVRFVRNIEKPSSDPSKFIVASGMHYITVNDARVTTQEDVMAAYFLGSAATNSSGNVFDPIVYPLVDLMGARAEMNKKDIRNNYTFPTVRVKYVSEVIFRGQSNTTITVSTADNVLTERMNFTGRASSVTNGARIRVYYTIAKDPLEKWEIQAIERL